MLNAASLLPKGVEITLELRFNIPGKELAVTVENSMAPLDDSVELGKLETFCQRQIAEMLRLAVFNHQGVSSASGKTEKIRV